MKRKFIRDASLAAGILLAGMTSVFAQPFELDGNATSGDYPGTEWDVVNLPGDSGVTEAETNLIVDLPEPHEGIFHGGGSKDEQDISNWGWRDGNPPDKDNLTNAYAAAVTYDPLLGDGDHFYLVFGMDRYDTSGDAQLGFWFTQDDVYPIESGAGNGDWHGLHSIGDILVLVNFSNGGTTPAISVYTWNGATAVPVATGADVTCSGGWIPAGSDHCGIVNAGNVQAPWDYYAKGVGLTASFPPNAFFEGAIDLTALNIEACFTSFLAESRSSTSITATLKDFAGGGFPVCSISVSKTCNNPRLNEAEDMIIYDIFGTVSNDGFGTVYNVGLSDNPTADGDFIEVDCGDMTTETGETFPLESLASSACYRNTITVPLGQNGTSDTVTAVANTKADDTGTALADSASATCPNLQISPALYVEKDCVTEVVVDGGQVVAKVNVTGKVCNVGDTKLSNVQVDDLLINTTPDPLISGATLPAPSSPGLPVESGSCMNYSGSYFPSAALDTNGLVTNDPHAVVFKDTVEATATDIFNQAVQPQTDMAECPLCQDPEN